MLIDQRYSPGIEVTFFGWLTKFNPFSRGSPASTTARSTAAGLSAVIDGRFRYQIVGPHQPGRDARGCV